MCTAEQLAEALAIAMEAGAPIGKAVIAALLLASQEGVQMADDVKEKVMDAISGMVDKIPDGLVAQVQIAVAVAGKSYTPPCNTE